MMLKIIFYEFSYIYKYRFNAVLMYILLGVMGYGFVKGLGNLGHSTTPFLLAYLLWSFYQSTANSVGWSFMGYAEQGVIERLFSVRRSPLTVSLIYILSTIPQGFIDTVYLYIVFYFFKVSPHIKYLGLLLITFMSLSPFFIGVGLAFIGLFLLIKRAGVVVELVNGILIGAGIFSVVHLPGIIYKFLDTVPYTYAAHTLFNLLNSKITVRTFITLEVKLLTISVIYLLIGIMIFKYCYNRARREGTLGHY